MTVSGEAAELPPHDPLTERQREAYRLASIYRMPQREIAEKMGITQQSVSELIRVARAKMPAVDHTELRRGLLDMHEEVIRRALSLAELEGAPVTVGKDGDILREPDSGEVVRDYAGRVAAYNLALKAAAELRKLEGLDAAAKMEIGATVRYEVVGVDTEMLK